MKVCINNIIIYVDLENVYYCPKIDSNFFYFDIFEAKSFEFKVKDGFLNVKDTTGNIILESQHKNTIYPLSQPKNAVIYYSPATVQAYKAIKVQFFEL